MDRAPQPAAWYAPCSASTRAGGCWWERHAHLSVYLTRQDDRRGRQCRTLRSGAGGTGLGLRLGAVAGTRTTTTLGWFAWPTIG
eukprot:scaffold2250_cov399-Prasinococcus_capsulatus_cf.AAC.2